MNLKHPIHLNSSEFNQNAHQYFAWMREESPVYKSRFLRSDAYLLTRYDDVAAALKHPSVKKNPNNSKNGGFWLPPTLRPLLHNMLNTDEPDHRRLRNLVQKAFTPRMVANLEGRITTIAHQLLDKAAQQKQVDLIQSFALPLPVAVISEMIGIPEPDRDRFVGWVAKFAVNPTPFNLLKAVPSTMAFFRYTRKLAAERRENPQDDLITALALAENEGDRFSEDELLGMVFLLVLAGHETTVNLIANGTLALLSNPDQLELLRNDFGLMETAVEELLRYDGPLHHTEMCFATEPLDFHGTTIPKGALLFPCLLAANRDPRAFDMPETLDITRSPNRHLAFGHGIHYCLGAPLARLEAKIAFCSLLERFPNLQLAVPKQSLEYQSMVMVHRLKQLPVKLS